MSYTLQITDGTTTIDLNDTSSYCQIFGDWSPAVAEKNSAGLGGQPYLPVTEKMTLTITGTSASDVLSKAEAIRAMLEQAQRWHDGENVSPVIVKYAPYSGATAWQSPIHGGNLEMPGTFTNVDTNYILEPVTLSFVRDGAWYGDEETAVANLLNNGDFETDVSGWSGYLGTISRDTSIVPDGCLRLTSDGTPGHSSAFTTAKTDIVVTENVEYSLTGYVRADTSTSVQLKIVWYDSAQATLSTSHSGSVSTQNVWTQIELTETAPSGAAYASVSMSLLPSATPNFGDNFYLDGVRFYSTAAAAANTSSTNPAVLSLDFADTLTTPAPVDFTLSATNVGFSQNIYLLAARSTAYMSLIEAESGTASGSVAVGTLGGMAYSGGSAMKATGSGSILYSNPLSGGRRLGAVLAMRTAASTFGWRVRMGVSGDGSYSQYPRGAWKYLPEGNIWRPILLGPVASPFDITQIYIEIEIVGTYSSGGDLLIDYLMIFDADETNIIHMPDALSSTASGGFDIQIDAEQNILSEPLPTLHNTATGYLEALAYTGNLHTWLSGNSIAVGWVGMSATTGQPGAWTGDYAVGSARPITLKNVTRRKAVLIPQ